MACGRADIGEDPYPEGAVRNDILNRLAGVVRHGVGLYLDVTHCERSAAVHNIDLYHALVIALAGFARGSPGPMRDPDRNTVLRGKPKGTTHVVVVFMRDDDPGDVPRFKPKARKPAHSVADGQAAIEQQAGPPHLCNETIAFASAGE